MAQSRRPGHLVSWSGRWDSNPRRPAWEAGILPLNYARLFLHKEPQNSGRSQKPKTSSSITAEFFDRLQFHHGFIDILLGIDITRILFQAFLPFRDSFMD